MDFVTFFFECLNFLYKLGQFSYWMKIINVDDFYRFRLMNLTSLDDSKTYFQMDENIILDD